MFRHHSAAARAQMAVHAVSREVRRQRCRGKNRTGEAVWTPVARQAALFRLGKLVALRIMGNTYLSFIIQEAIFLPFLCVSQEVVILYDSTVVLRQLSDIYCNSEQIMVP